MKKIILLVSLALSINAIAQVPNYVPTNGLVGWWRFSGNANDESGNNLNLTLNQTTYSSDRFGDNNSALLLNGTNWGENQNNQNFVAGSWSYSFWINANNFNSSPLFIQTTFGYADVFNLNYFAVIGTSSGIQTCFSSGLTTGSWDHIVTIYNEQSNSLSIYKNGLLMNSSTTNGILNQIIGNIYVGKRPNNTGYFDGKIDDIGIWNRALTTQEIADLYNAINCYNNTAITPTANSLIIGSTATFSATTSDSNPSYVWQSDFGQGFQTLNNFGNYNGTNTGTLNIANVQLPNHTQPIRVMTTSGNCVDTSNVSIINILDTCITNVKVYDTLLTTVTDTLLINAIITGLNPPNNLNTIKVFPNPASTHITIDYGNFNAMSGYTLAIVNSIGQTVFTTPINQQTSYIELSTWTGIGIYFVQLVDSQNNTIENRKILIQ